MYKGNDKKQFIRVPKMLKQNIRKHDEHMGAKELSKRTHGQIKNQSFPIVKRHRI